MQVDGGEKCQLALVCTGLQLGLCPVKIRLDLLLQLLQHGQVFSMHAVLAQFNSVAGYKLVGLVVFLIKGLLTPVQNGFELIDAALYGLDLVVGLSVTAVDAGLSVRIFRIPDQVGHHGLELSAGNQRVAADFCILFDHKNGVAVLGGLSRRGDTGAAGTDNDHVSSHFNGIAGLVLDLGSLESFQIGASGLLRGIVHNAAQGTAGKGGTGNAVYAGAVGFLHLGDHDVKGNIADVGSFHGRKDLDPCERGFGERDLRRHIAVVAVRGGFIVTGSKSHGSAIGSRGFSARQRQCLFDCFGNTVACHGRTGNSVDLTVFTSDQRCLVGFKVRDTEGKFFFT